MISEPYFQTPLPMISIIINNSMFLQIHFLGPRIYKHYILQKLSKPRCFCLCPLANLEKAILSLSVEFFLYSVYLYTDILYLCLMPLVFSESHYCHCCSLI